MNWCQRSLDSIKPTYYSLSLITLPVTVILLAISLLTGCAPIRAHLEAQASPLLHVDVPRSTNSSINVNKAVRGYWETVESKVSPFEYLGRIYDSNWYAIESYQEGNIRVVWDDGLTCRATEGRSAGNEIYLTEPDLETIFVFYDDAHATVTFRRGQTTYVKQLKKTRDDPTPACA